ncbi:MAG: cysteine desulfurase family protein [Corynebacterium sp.]|nr:cysteine desulfurase family protein [Corynebacterium sp.]
MRYFDHAATTFMRPCAREAWLNASTLLNPAGQYQLGRKARSVLEDARETVATLLGCEPIEVIFTASGTESDNIALVGLWQARRAAHNRVVTTTIEHSAVYETAQYLKSQGAHLDILPVTGEGIVHDPDNFLGEPAAVVSCMWANNETGAIQPIPEIVAKAQATGSPVHVDAVQAVGKLPINFHESGITTLAASGHKFGGPRGVGILLARRSPAPEPLFHGGGQERGLRSGTVDVAGAAGLAAALQEAHADMEAEMARVAKLKTQLISAVTANIPGAVINTPTQSLPTHLNVSFPGAEGDSLIMLLDAAGIAASTGSACANGVNRASRILLAQRVAEKLARGTLRLTMGYTTTQEDVDHVIQHLAKAVDMAQRAGMA